MQNQERTQKEAILEYIDFKGEFIPAQMIGKMWKDTMFGSEIGKRCREMRQVGILNSIRDGKFEKYFRAQRIKIDHPIGLTQEGQDRLFSLPPVISS